MEQQETDRISDGYHTFGELYDHRRALTAALCKLHPGSWRSKQHHPEDSPIFDGYFVVGLTLTQGQISYHCKLAHWHDFAAVPALAHAPKYDGHTPADTVDRLLAFAGHCPHCPDGHGSPSRTPWGVYVAPERDSDGQPIYLRVQPSGGAHVADEDATWLWNLIRNAGRAVA